MVNIALRFGSDSVAAIEQNRRRCRATSRILRLSCDQRWPEDEMQDGHVVFLQALIALQKSRAASGAATPGSCP
jgi:hypothetical protein